MAVSDAMDEKELETALVLHTDPACFYSVSAVFSKGDFLCDRWQRKFPGGISERDIWCNAWKVVFAELLHKLDILVDKQETAK